MPDQIDWTKEPPASVVDKLFPPDGPFTAEDVVGAAELFEETLLYLARATTAGNREQCLTDPEDLYRVAKCLNGGTNALGTLLDHLRHYAPTYGDDPKVYDDRTHVHRPAETAEKLGDQFNSGFAALYQLSRALDQAQSSASHLGRKP